MTLEKSELLDLTLDLYLDKDKGCVVASMVFDGSKGPVVRSWHLVSGALSATQAEDIAAYVRSVAYHSVVGRVMCQEVLPLA